MIDFYIINYTLFAAGLFFFGAAFHFVMLLLGFDSDWSLAKFLTKGLSTGTAAIIPPFFFVFVRDDVLQKIEGIEYYLAISALVLFYFSVQALIPQRVFLRNRTGDETGNSATLRRPPPHSPQPDAHSKKLKQRTD